MSAPRLVAVVAASENDVIGREGQLPWRLPADLAHFKRLTLGKPVLMGRKTYDSIGKPLPGRLNVVLSRTAEAPEGCVVARSLDEALAIPEVASADEVMVIGGARVYDEALSRCVEVQLTRVHGTFEGDAFFRFDASEWERVAVERREADEKNPWAMSFESWRRRS